MRPPALAPQLKRGPLGGIAHVSTTIDIILGLGAGAVAGAAFRPAFHAAWRWGWGPQRLGRFGQILAASVASGAVGSALLVGSTLPFKPFVQTWRQFLFAWVVGLAVGGIVMVLRQREDAA